MNKSLLGKYWQEVNTDEKVICELSRGLRISDFLARILSQRIKSPEFGIDFLNPKIKNLIPDPFHLLGMKQGVDRVIQAINTQEKICIFADYDVDGATSSALLKNILSEFNIEIDIYVPDRIIEGYGPNKTAIQKIKDSGINLIITVDCGSVAFEALEHAALIGLEVIVIDHHLSTDILPKAVAVINPNRIDQESDCKNLAAVGVTFLFVVALVSELKKNSFFSKNNLVAPDLLSQLDIVALGTVCDVMQLTGLNRAFVSQGLKVARLRRNVGYRALCDIAEISEAINSYHLGFIIGPRINAGGRVGKSHLGASLLSTKSDIEALNIAKELDKHNNERKVIELRVLEEAKEIAETQQDQAILFITGENWHLGVIGIVAGRLKEQYNKPVAVLAIAGDKARASCRSVRGVDFGTKIVIAKEKGLLITGGGHAMAAGFTVHKTKLKELQEFLNNEIAKDLAVSKVHLAEFYDAKITTAAVNLDLMEEIAKLEPYGIGNPAPIFKFSNLYVLKANIVGIKHIRIVFAPAKATYSSKPLTAIAFNSVGTVLGEAIMSSKPHNFSIFGNLKVNKWQDRKTVQLQLKDLIIEKAC